MKFLFAADRAVQAIHRIAATTVVIYYLAIQVWSKHQKSKDRGS